MSQFPSGSPSFRKSFFDDDTPPDYRNILKEKEIPPESILSWQQFWDFAHKDEFLSRFWEIGPSVILSGKCILVISLTLILARSVAS